MSKSPDLLTFPISPEYLQNSWGIPEGIRELIANALDEDDQPRVEYINGQLEIEDAGIGLPRQGLVLGISRDNSTGGRKNSGQIGQFGEGLLIGLLVMARENKDVLVETVGYSFRPAIVHDENLDCEVLQIQFGESTRTRGTCITVRVTEKQADAAKSKFRYFDEDYNPRQRSGLIIDPTDKSKRGNVYLGGVFVRKMRELRFSYDLALNEDSKLAQNRDRSVLDGYRLEGGIRELIADCTDKKLIAAWVKAAINGELHRAEFAAWGMDISPQTTRLMRDAAKKQFGTDKLMWVANGSEEVLLDLQDRGYKVVRQHGDYHTHAALMKLLGIDEAKRKRQRMVTERSKSKTTWVKDPLSEYEQDVLDNITRMAKLAWGDTCLGKGGLRIYSHHVAEAGDTSQKSWLGFYNPVSDMIGLHRQLLLQGFDDAFSVLLHECAHRRAIKNPYKYDQQWQDRTRGFQDALSDLGMDLAKVLMRRGAVEETSPKQDLSQLLKNLMQQQGYLKATQLAKAASISPGMVHRITKQRVGESTPQNQHIEKYGQALGIDPAVVYLVTISETMAIASRKANGQLYGKNYKDASMHLDHLETLGGEFASAAKQIREHVEGSNRDLPFNWKMPRNEDFHLHWEIAKGERDGIITKPAGNKYSYRGGVTANEPYLMPYRQLLAAEQARLAAAAA